jgi:hypothetical protein
MKQIYELIAQRIQNQVEEIKWIDLDNGQIDYYEYRVNVDFPAVLINIKYPYCEDIGTDGIQLCDVEIELRTVFNLFDETNIDAPQQVRDNALEIFQIINKIHACLQNWRNDGTCGTISRQSITKESRTDGSKVYSMVYKTTYYDHLAVRTPQTDVDASPAISQP